MYTTGWLPSNLLSYLTLKYQNTQRIVSIFIKNHHIITKLLGKYNAPSIMAI